MKSFLVSRFGGMFYALCAFVLDVLRLGVIGMLDIAYAVRGACEHGKVMHRPHVRKLQEYKWLMRENGFTTLLLRVQFKKRLQAISVLLLLLTPECQGQELTAEWFKQNYLPASEILNKAYSECSGKVYEVNKSNDSSDWNEINRVFSINGDSRKFERTITEHNGGQYIAKRAIVASPDASFSVLTRDADNPLLEMINRSDLGYKKAIESIDAEASDSLFSAFGFFTERVSSWIRKPNFRFKKITRNADNVRVDFQCTDNDGMLYEGYFTVLPDRQWVLSNWDIAVTKFKPELIKWRVASTLSYNSDQPVPALSTVKEIGYQGQRTTTKEMTISDLLFVPPPVADFKLSAYGYDDHLGEPSVRPTLWLWCAGIGMLCVITAILLRKRYA